MGWRAPAPLFRTFPHGLHDNVEQRDWRNPEGRSDQQTAKQCHACRVKAARELEAVAVQADAAGEMRQLRAFCHRLNSF
jgi:hypothetical protein